MTGKREIIIINDGIFASVVKTANSVAWISGLIVLGVLLNSTAMQWAGFFLGFIILFGAAANFGKTFTITEASDYLDKLEREGGE